MAGQWDCQRDRLGGRSKLTFPNRFAANIVGAGCGGGCRVGWCGAGLRVLRKIVSRCLYLEKE